MGSHFTKVPNELLDHLAEIGYAEIKVLLIVMRQTCGYHRLTCKLSLADLVSRTGLTRQGVINGLRSAEKGGLIRRTNPGEKGKAEWEISLEGSLVNRLPGSQVNRLPRRKSSLVNRLPEASNLTSVVKLIDYSYGVKDNIKDNIKEINGSAAKNAARKCEIDQAISQANPLVDAVLAGDSAARRTWPGREKMPEAIRDLLDVFVEVTGIRPLRDQVNDWFATGSDWLEIGATKDDIRAAYKRSQPDHNARGGFPVNRPGSLTSTIQAVTGDRRKSGGQASTLEWVRSIKAEKGNA